MILKTAYPRPDFARGEWMNLNGTWDFSFDEPVFDRTIEVPYPWGSPLSGVDESKDAVGYYRRSVKWNPRGERVVLCFGAVDAECEVTVNGKAVGGHSGGYCPFSLDVTAAWKRRKANEIVVKATDLGTRDRTYGKQGYGNARGIWQTVWLESRPAGHIDNFFVRTKLDGTVTFTVTTAGVPDGTLVRAEFPAAGKTSSAKVKNNAARVTLKVEDPRLWDLDDPYLYEGALLCGDDRVETYFGIREIGTGVFGAHGRRWITLNGKPVYLCGTLDQSFNPQGFFTLPSDDDCRDEIARLKRIGVNMARIHIKAEEPLKLYWADRLGVLIMEDIPCFWDEPLPETRARFEREMEEQIVRDRNHPAIFYWVIFNETWGLFDQPRVPGGPAGKVYSEATAKWVVKCWERAKKLDPTRLVEDNSPCNRDHTKTDCNTWHFYSNGYGRVKNVIASFCEGAYVGSQKNYKDGWTMEDVPCMNSECGAVWGLKGNAGESDISWQYKYMMNEFRLHDLLCGFVFTEFHDVVNEFNGYYKLDNGDKEFGYDLLGMTLADLHVQDYLGADFPPMKTVAAGEEVRVPMFASSFTDERHGKTLTVEWCLKADDPLDGAWVETAGSYQLFWSGYGTFPAGEIVFTVPQHDGVLALMWNLVDGDEVIARNGLLFDAECPRGDVLTLAPGDFAADGWKRSFTAQEGGKLNGLGSGSFTASVKTAEIPGFADADDLRIVLEASTRPPMTHDWPEDAAPEKPDGSYMLGYRIDPGANQNSFVQTDAVKHPGTMEVLIDGTAVGTVFLPDSPADFRGCLSAHYQAADDRFDEMASYGTLVDLRVPSSVLFRLKEKESFTLTLRTADDCGLSLFGRRSGRYGIGIVIAAE